MRRDPSYQHDRIRSGRRLRRESTKYEKHLWYEFLRYCPIKFRRQVPFGPYVLDFYSQAARLAVELDGMYHLHDEVSLEDKARTAWLEKEGVTVMRFFNKDVEEDAYSVYLTIKLKLSELGFDLEC